MSQTHARLAAIALAFTMTACGSDATAPPPPPSYSGTYTITRWAIGTAQFPVLCNVVGMAVTLTHTGTTLGGSHQGGSIQCPATNANVPAASGPISGTVDGVGNARFTILDFTVTGGFSGTYFAGTATAALDDGTPLTGALEMRR